jgi:ArsR family transcriptional regulator, virulence genes transcriptional regulator
MKWYRYECWWGNWVNHMLNVLDATAVLDAMANHHRFAILSIICRQEISVGDLQQKIGLSQSALSQHLAKLRAKNIVTTRKEAQSIFYRCDNEAVHRILTTLESIFDADAQPMPKASLIG